MPLRLIRVVLSLSDGDAALPSFQAPVRVRSELTERFGGVMAFARRPAEGLRRRTAGRFATSTLRGGMATGAALTEF